MVTWGIFSWDKSSAWKLSGVESLTWRSDISLSDKSPDTFDLFPPATAILLVKVLRFSGPSDVSFSGISSSSVKSGEFSLGRFSSFPPSTFFAKSSWASLTWTLRANRSLNGLLQTQHGSGLAKLWADLMCFCSKQFSINFAGQEVHWKCSIFSWTLRWCRRSALSVLCSLGQSLQLKSRLPSTFVAYNGWSDCWCNLTLMKPSMNLLQITQRYSFVDWWSRSCRYNWYLSSVLSWQILHSNRFGFFSCLVKWCLFRAGLCENSLGQTLHWKKFLIFSWSRRWCLFRVCFSVYSLGRSLHL